MVCHKSYGQFVLPVFYGVEPSVVRKESGFLGEALKASARSVEFFNPKRKKENLLSKWKTALTEVANLIGWDSHSISEGKLVKQIVEDILSKLVVSLSITEFPIGLDWIIDYQSSKACMIGIWGMGGSGKTTTAKALYN
ncbi:unnamed protein product [Lathyrus oleraceus]